MTPVCFDASAAQAAFFIAVFEVASERYADFVGAAYNYGIVNGRGDGTFDPDSNITWQEAMIMIRNAAEISELAGSQQGSIAAYPGASSGSDWARGAVAFYTASGLFVHNGKLRRRYGLR